jgi:multidrug transporter EmrE-like cation transporter
MSPLARGEFRTSDEQSIKVETIMIFSWINLWVAIAMSLAGQTLLKAGTMDRPDSTALLAQFLDPRTVAGFTLYTAAAFLYIIALRRIPLSVALPCTAASYIGAIFIGHFLYNETVTLIHLTAVAFIGCGVILLALAAK